MSLWTDVRDFAEDPITPIAFQVGGASGANAAHNLVEGNPLTENAKLAGGADLAGLAFGGGVAYSGLADTGYGAAEGGPELLAGPGPTSSSVTDAAFGASGDTVMPSTDPFFGGEGGLAPIAGSAASSTGMFGSGITPMGAFLGLNVLSTGYGLYQAQQLEKQRKSQLKRQQEYQDKLNMLMSNPSSLTSTPGYQFGLDQGTQALQRRMASMGYNKSGNLATAVQRYGSDYATNALTQQEQILAQAYGMSGPTVQYMDPISLVGRSLANLGYGVARA